MIFNNNGSHLYIIGYKQSTITQEIAYMFEEGIARGDAPGLTFEVIDPTFFLVMDNKESYQYLVMFNKDLKLRNKVIAKIEELNLNCVSAMHHTSWAPSNANIAQGTVIGPYASLYQHASVGKHCVIEAYSMVGHYTHVGDNVHIRPNVMIAGSTIVGSNCVFGSRSTVLEHLSICDNVAVGALTNVRKDITQPGMYVGTSAKRVGDFK